MNRQVDQHTYTYYKVDFFYVEDNVEYGAFYSRDIRTLEQLGQFRKETIGLGKGNDEDLSKAQGFVIIKITKDDLSVEYEVCTRNTDDDVDSIKNYASNWMEKGMKKDVFTETEKRDSLDLAGIFDILKINLSHDI